jgi:glycosyltransferase involved in cell wall biosynthesis
MQWFIASVNSLKARLQDIRWWNNRTSKRVLLLGYKGFTDNFAVALERAGFSVDFREVAKLWEVSTLTQFDLVIVNWAEIQLRFSKDLAGDLSKVRQCLATLKSAGIGLVWVVHNIFPHELSEERRPFYDSLIQAFISSSDLVVAMNSVEEKLLGSLGCSPQQLLPLFHPNYLTEFEGLLWSQQEARERLSLPDSLFIYIVVGYVRPYKGVLDIIRAFKEGRANNEKLFIVGHDLDKEHSAQVRLLSDENVTAVLRFVSREELALYLAAADVVIMNHAETRNTNTGALALAQTFKKPVICPNHGSFRELTTPQSALLFNGYEGLKEQIRAVKCRDLGAMGDAGFAEVAEKSWDLFATAIKRRLYGCESQQLSPILTRSRQIR